MIAALSVIVLLTLSLVIIRIASVVMRITGLPDHVARFQCISAFTGTGYTTRESEMIVNYPIRRKILVTLMLIGNLGLVSVLSTLIIAFVSVESSTDAMTHQLMLIVLSVLVVGFMALNETVDKIFCGFISRLLHRYSNLATRSYQRMLQIDEGMIVAEHSYRRPESGTLSEMGLEREGLILLALHSYNININQTIPVDSKIRQGDILVCYGSEDVHQRFGESINGL
jgi:hypothetical protein